MALIEKLNNIGDAIRSKTGKSEKLSLDAMATEIRGISGGFWDEETVKAFIENNYTVSAPYSLSLPDGLTKISAYKFYADSNLTLETDLPSTVSEIENYAFMGCNRLTLATLPSSLNKIGTGTFSDCSGLISITIPSKIWSIGDKAFAGCSNLREVTFEGTPRTLGTQIFHNCSSLETINVPWGENDKTNTWNGLNNATINYNYAV